MPTMIHTTQLTVQECCNCHVTFAIPKSWDDALRQSHATFYCPAGHGLSYRGETEEEKLRKRLKLEQRWNRDAEASNTALRDQLGATERSLRGHKAANTRIKNRIAAGVCPCCNRSFQNVARHMAGQHPDFTSNQDKTHGEV